MNYRHAFHAGNFADVVKHATLARILTHLLAKPAAFRVIDTHAGAGLYDLRGEEASRSGEWHAGIERLLTATIAPAVQALLKPYLDVVANLNKVPPLVPAHPRLRGNEPAEGPSLGAEYALTTYPGSPALARALLRAQDRLVACELEPKAFAALAHNLARDRRIKTVALDGWVALNAYVPPPERRGVVVIDPPYEDAEEFLRLAQSLELAHRKWASGIYLLWYPIKGRQEPDALARSLKRSGIARILRAEMAVGATSAQGPLGGCGLVIVNPPWTLADELSVLLPALAKALSSRNSNHRLDWIAGEN
jgi:23S rRNA (adenine2030-N6)-methyltransferase